MVWNSPSYGALCFLVSGPKSPSSIRCAPGPPIACGKALNRPISGAAIYLPVDISVSYASSNSVKPKNKKSSSQKYELLNLRADRQGCWITRSDANLRPALTRAVSICY